MSSPAILVVGPSWVGDMVMAQSLFKILAERHADVAVDVLAPGWSLPVVARMPEVRQGIATGSQHGKLGLGTRWHLGKRLRGKYARAIVLPRSLKSALVPWFARIPVRTGFRGEMRFGLINDMRPFDPALLDQTVKRFVALGLGEDETLPSLPFPKLEVSAENQQKIVAQLRLEMDRPIVALMPGAEYGPAKCWPLKYFSKLAQSLTDDGYRVWIVGSDKDSDAGKQILAGARNDNRILNLCGRTSLADVIDLLAMTEQVVGNDSGLMHIAAAVGTHTHAIYGSTSPGFTPPLTEARDIYYLDIECSPCMQRVCPLGHLRCLREIVPELVHAGVLARRPA